MLVVKELRTSSRFIPVLETEKDMMDFFSNCRHFNTVDLKVEGVLIRNGFMAPLMGLKETLAQADILGYPLVVQKLLECAIEHKRLIRKEREETQRVKELS